MKVKLKKGIALANNWKSCGCTKENWDDLNAGKSIEVSSVPELILYSDRTVLEGIS